jgi:transposase
MLLGFKTQLALNNKQRTLAARHAGVARHAYNWGLAICKQAVEAKQKLPTAKVLRTAAANDLHKRLVAEVKKANPWYYEVSKCAPQQALRNLEQALKRWRSGQGRFPRFKRKGVRESFYLESNIRISGNCIKVPIFGWLRCAELLPTVTPKNVVMSLRAGRWYISFKYEAPPPQVEKTGDVVGVDLGVNRLATCSSGERTPSRYRERRQLEYKAQLYGCQLVVVDRFYPSSQLCSRCGHRQKMLLHQRVFRCERCGLELDRDLNAALNLVQWYLATCSSRGSDACGDPSGGVVGVNSATSHGSQKQEESRDATNTALSQIGVFVSVS